MAKPNKSGTASNKYGDRSFNEIHRRKSFEDHGETYARSEKDDLNHQKHSSENQCKIPVHVTISRDYSKLYKSHSKMLQRSQLKKELITIRRSNKAIEALTLPTVVNINPRSLNNKVESFKTYMEEEDIDLAFISESHERAEHPLVDSLNMEDFEVISNVHQRRGKGGRPALIVRKK